MARGDLRSILGILSRGGAGQVAVLGGPPQLLWGDSGAAREAGRPPPPCSRRELAGGVGGGLELQALAEAGRLWGCCLRPLLTGASLRVQLSACSGMTQGGLDPC